MQFLELLILSVTVRLDNGGDKEALQRHTVFGEIRDEKFVYILGKYRQVFVNLKNIDGVCLNDLCNIGLDSHHQKSAEKRDQFLLTQIIFSADEFYKQFAAVFRTKRHFAGCADCKRESVLRINILHFTVGTPLDRHLLGLVDEIDFTVERGLIAGSTVQYFTDLGDILRFQRVAPGSEQIQRLTVHEENSLLRFMHDQLCQTIKIFARMFHI